MKRWLVPQLGILLLLVMAGYAFAAPIVSFGTDQRTITTNKTAAAVIPLFIRLNQPATHNVTVDLMVSGTARGADQDFGVGKDFTLGQVTGAKHKVTIPAGQVTPLVQPTITIANNPVVNLDKTLLITLSHPVNAELSATGDFLIMIKDDERRHLIPVDNPGGALGIHKCACDGSTDDTDHLQYLIDYLRENGGGVFLFPAHKTLRFLKDDGTGLKLPSVNQFGHPVKISFIGDPGDGGTRSATLKLRKVPKKTFWHAIKTLEAGKGYCWAGATDSPPMAFINLTFDGNGPAYQPDWWNWAMEQYFLFSMGAFKGDSNENVGRLKCIWDNCHIKNSVSDGVSIEMNCDATFYQTDFTDNPRGGITGLGGWAKITGRDLNFYSTPAGPPPGPHEFMSLHIEQYPGGVGYQRSRRLDINLTNVNLSGALQLGTLGPNQPGDGDGSSWTFTNVKQSSTYRAYLLASLRNVTFTATNCEFHGSGDRSGYISNVTNATFTNCIFYGHATNDSPPVVPSSAVFVTMDLTQSGYAPISNGLLTFKSCQFLWAADLGNNQIPAIAQMTSPNSSDTGQNNRIVMSNCTFDPNAQYALWNGKLFTLDNPMWQNPAGYLFWVSAVKGSAFNATIKNLDLTTGKYCNIQEIDGTADVYLNNNNVTVSKGANQIRNDEDGITNSRFHISGMRIIEAGDNTLPTSATNGLWGDQYQLQNGQVYTCTQSGGGGYPAAWVGPKR